MEFLNPAALYGLYALPLLLVPYFIQRKPRRVVFSSLLLFIEQHGSQATAKPWGRLRLPLAVFSSVAPATIVDFGACRAGILRPLIEHRYCNG